jgi:hypothetical protein
LRRSGADAPFKCERHIASSATEIKNTTAGAIQGDIETSRRSPPPQAIDIERENMI